MRAFQLRSYDGPEGLVATDVAAPTSDRDVVIDVRAVGINYPDLLMTQGRYQHRPELPVVPGCEIAGVVRDAPPASGWSRGDRVAAFVWQGGYAEQAVVPLHALVRVPDSIELSTAAAMVVNYHTVHFALARRARLVVEETVFVMGAGGGIGTAALQVARGLGARVIAGIGRDSHEATVRAAGTDEIIRLDEGFATELRRLTDGRGVDVVLDPLGDRFFDEAVRGLAPEGRILVVGFAAGAVPALKVNRLLLRNASAVGVAFGAFLELEQDLMARQATSLDLMVAAGFVEPVIAERSSFDDLPEVLGRLAQGRIRGKSIVTLP